MTQHSATQSFGQCYETLAKAANDPLPPDTKHDKSIRIDSLMSSSPSAQCELVIPDCTRPQVPHKISLLSGNTIDMAPMSNLCSPSLLTASSDMHLKRRGSLSPDFSSTAVLSAHRELSRSMCQQKTANTLLHDHYSSVDGIRQASLLNTMSERQANQAALLLHRESNDLRRHCSSLESKLQSQSAQMQQLQRANQCVVKLGVEWNRFHHGEMRRLSHTYRQLLASQEHKWKNRVREYQDRCFIVRMENMNLRTRCAEALKLNGRHDRSYHNFS